MSKKPQNSSNNTKFSHKTLKNRASSTKPSHKILQNSSKNPQKTIKKSQDTSKIPSQTVKTQQKTPKSLDKNTKVWYNRRIAPQKTKTPTPESSTPSASTSVNSAPSASTLVNPTTPKASTLPKNLKVALVCDWLTNVGGAEKVLLAIHQIFPSAPIYTSQYNPRGIDWFHDADVRTGWLQIFPSRLRRLLAPLRQRYFSHLDLSDYDLIISVTGAEAKSVKFHRSALSHTSGSASTNITPPSASREPSSSRSPSEPLSPTQSTSYATIKTPTPAKPSAHISTKTSAPAKTSPHASLKVSTPAKSPIHLCYCHVPTQYYWQMYDDYVKNPSFGILNPLVRPCFKLLVGRLRRADHAAAQLPTAFITISSYAQSQIEKYYQRQSTVIAPPVEVEKFQLPQTNTAISTQTSTRPSAKISTQKSTPRLAHSSVSNAKPTSSSDAKSPSASNPTLPTSNASLTPAPVTNPPFLPGYFLNFSRQVSWKRLDLAIKACQKTGERLVLVGDGPEHHALIKLAAATPVVNKKELLREFWGIDITAPSLYYTIDSVKSQDLSPKKLKTSQVNLSANSQKPTPSSSNPKTPSLEPKPSATATTSPFNAKKPTSPIDSKTPTPRIDLYSAQISPDGQILFLPPATSTQLRAYLCGASAFLFPSLEPFGIAPVEALSAGVPVVAYAQGGATDYITDGKNGLLFPSQTVTSLVAAIKKIRHPSTHLLSPTQISLSASPYSPERFKTELKEFIYAELQ